MELLAGVAAQPVPVQLEGPVLAGPVSAGRSYPEPRREPHRGSFSIHADRSEDAVPWRCGLDRTLGHWPQAS